MWTAKLITIGIVALSLMAAVASFIHGQREIGKAAIRAEYAEQQAEAEKLNAQRALEGEAYALKLLAKAEKRAQQRAAQAASDALARQAASDARAAEDREYALWRESRVDRIDADRLRQFAESLTATAGHRGVSDGVSANPNAAGTARPPDQRGAGGVRFSPLGTVARWLGLSRSSGE